MKLYEIDLESTNKAYIKERVDKIIVDLGLRTTFPWKNHPLYGSIHTKGGVELKESEGYIL